MKIIHILIFFLSLGFVSIQAGNPLTIDLGFENGYFQSEILGDRLILRLIGRLNYNQKFDKNFINIKARVSPELYGTSLDATTYKLNGELKLGGEVKSFYWQANITHRNYAYRSDRFDNVTFEFFRLGFSLTRSVSEKISLGSIVDYYYRDNSESPRSQLDNYHFAVSGTYRINRANLISLDLSYEVFIITRDSVLFEFNTNEGTRYGPVISFNHRSGQLINFSYELMHHQSDLFGWEYWEHRLHFLWGSYLSKKWSAFIFVNYLFRPDQNPEETFIDLTYTPANNETGYHLKLGYDLRKQTEIYTKVGYTKDELQFQSTELSGWQYLIGMNFRF